MVNARGNIWGNKIPRRGQKFIFRLRVLTPEKRREIAPAPLVESLLGKRFAKDDLTVHRDDREDQRQTFAVAVWPSGADFGPE